MKKNLKENSAKERNLVNFSIDDSKVGIVRKMKPTLELKTKGQTLIFKEYMKKTKGIY